MTRKQRRLGFVAAGLVTLGVAVALVLSAFEDSLVFFYSPTDLVTKEVPTDRRIRIGGLVVKGSVKRGSDMTIQFGVTDTANTVPVLFRGVLPDLFREGQGIVAEGKFEAGGRFRADDVLAKHDENYMPREVVDSLKKAGVWQHAPENGAQPGKAAK
jgi:cytochrome c-type biogenesis protein CcmE